MATGHREGEGEAVGVRGGEEAALGGGTSAIVVYVTVPDKSTGAKLASSIVESKLAACVTQIPGVESTYRWEGKVTTDAEVMLMIKTRRGLLDELSAHVRANHPYEVPEVIGLPIVGGNAKYLEWITESTATPPL